jgi:hypothetical protein
LSNVKIAFGIGACDNELHGKAGRPILIKPFLYLLAFGQTAVLFAGVFGLACLLLMTCVRAIVWLPRAATENARKAKGPGGGGASLQGLKAVTDQT